MQLLAIFTSPADTSFEETLNTLKYAQQARNIRNIPIANVEPDEAESESLRQRIKALEVRKRLCS